MSPNALKKLIGALLAALAVWGVVALRTRDRSPAAPAELSALVAGMKDTASLTTVRFKAPEGAPVELTREGAAWKVNGRTADSGMVARFLTSLADATAGDLVARNAANHARLGLAADSAYTMELEGRTPAALLVGNAGSRYGTTYVRQPRSDEVWLVGADLRTPARRSLDDWRSRRVLALDTAAVARLEIQRDGESYSLTRTDSAWALADGTRADGAVVRDILGELRDLQADGLLTGTDSLAAREPGGYVVARGKDGGPLASLQIGSGEYERWLRPDGDSVTYRIPSYRVDRLAPKRERVGPALR